MMLQHVFGIDFNLNTIISGIVVFLVSSMWISMKRHWKKQERTHKLHDIKIESIVYGVQQSLNGQGELFVNNYKKRKEELIKEHKFTDGE